MCFGSMVWCLSLILKNSLLLFFTYFPCSVLSLFFFWGYNYMYIKPFVIVPQLLNGPSFIILFLSLCISVWITLFDLFSSSLILQSPVLTLLMSPLKTFLFAHTMLLISHFTLILSYSFHLCAKITHLILAIVHLFNWTF